MPRETGVRLPPWLLPVGCLLLWTAQLVAFHWGVITPDTVAQYAQALSGDYDDWHPPVMAWLWRRLIALHTGSAPMLVLDCSFYWIGILLFAEGLRRSGRSLEAIATIFVAAMPIPFGQMGSILKDSLLAASLLLASGTAAFFLIPGRPFPWPARAFCAALLILAAATRFNAAFAAAPLLLLCIAPRWWEQGWTRVAGGVVAAGLLLAISTVLINQVALQPERTRPILSLVNFDLAGISLASGRNVYPAQARPSLPLLRHCYTPAMFNRHDEPACGTVEERLDQLVDDGGPRPLHLWLNGILVAPVAYAEHRALHFNANQRWLVATVPHDAVYVMSQPNALGLRFEKNDASVAIAAAAQALAQSPFGRPATWLAVAAGILLAGSSLGPLARGLAASSLLYSAAYAVVSVAPDLRYNLWTMLAASLGLLAGARGLIGGISPPRRLALSFAPALLVVLGECAAIAQG